MSEKRSRMGGIGGVVFLGTVFALIRNIDFDEQPAPSPYYQHSEEAMREQEQRIMKEVMQNLHEERRAEMDKLFEAEQANSSSNSDSENPPNETQTQSTTPSKNSP